MEQYSVLCGFFSIAQGGGWVQIDGLAGWGKPLTGIQPGLEMAFWVAGCILLIGEGVSPMRDSTKENTSDQTQSLFTQCCYRVGAGAGDGSCPGCNSCTEGYIEYRFRGSGEDWRWKREPGSDTRYHYARTEVSRGVPGVVGTGYCGALSWAGCGWSECRAAGGSEGEDRKPDRWDCDFDSRTAEGSSGWEVVLQRAYCGESWRRDSRAGNAGRIESGKLHKTPVVCAIFAQAAFFCARCSQGMRLYTRSIITELPCIHASTPQVGLI